MAPGSFRFDRFVLDPADRQLRRDDGPVELNARYLDALLLLVSDAGRLVTKERFLDEVWRGVPVTDEALTQCIKMLRRQLGDDAARPRFIETVPKHGYRFIAPVEHGRAQPDVARTSVAPVPPAGSEPASGVRKLLLLGAAGTAGAGVAGIIGGLFYGSAAAAHPFVAGAGGASVLLVVLWLTLAAALTGGAGVSFGIAAAMLASAGAWRIIGGAAGGMIVGGVAKLRSALAGHERNGIQPRWLLISLDAQGD